MNTIQHGSWKFDYTPAKFIYNTNPENIVNSYFQSSDTLQVTSNETNIEILRKVAVMHRLVRKEILDKVHDGIKYTELVDIADAAINKYMKPEKYKPNVRGWAFPLGISVGNCLAHDSAIPHDTRTLSKNDVVKIDLGLHIDGNIIDSAVSVMVDGDDDIKEFYEPLLESTRDATFTAIYMSAPDASIYDISEAIQEVIESYELEDGTHIKAVGNLGGHNITPYKLHGGNLVLCSPNKMQENMRMKEGEIYAIETFASTGLGTFTQDSIDTCTHFMINDNAKIDRQFHKNLVANWAYSINNKLPFTQRQFCHLDKVNKYTKDAINNKYITAYPPLIDKVGSYTSQLEHTIHIKDNGVEILSLGKDY
jgi:methionyl aminopeptidase